MSKFKDYSGNKYGRLLALNLANPARFNNYTYWTFRCDCGEVVDKPIAKVVAGEIKSCGCLQREVYQFQNPIQGKRQQVLTYTELQTIKAELASGTSRRSLAKVLGISPSTIANYLEREKQYTIEQMNHQLIIESILGNYLVSGANYHSPLPDELTVWYCYTKDGGHNILCCLKQFYEQDNQTIDEEQMLPVPVKTVLKDYEIHKDGYVLVDLEYDSEIGLVFPSEDEEF